MIDTNKEAIAVAEANTLHIPVVAILDSNSSPDGIAYPIPGNDDAMRAVHLYSELVASAVLDGLQAELSASGVDIGARAEPRVVIESESAEEPVGEESLTEAAIAEAGEPAIAEAAEPAASEADATPAAQ